VEKDVKVPDIGDFEEVDVIDVYVSAGAEVAKEDPLICLESEKASMDIPSPYAGKVVDVAVSNGDKVSEGDTICRMEVEGAEDDEEDDVEEKPEAEAKEKKAAAERTSEKTAERETEKKKAPEKEETREEREPSGKEARDEKPAKPAPAAARGDTPPDQEIPKTVHAGPAVRRLAREMGVDLTQVTGTGRKGRIVADDVREFVKHVMGEARRPAGAGETAAQPKEIDFSKFGEVTREPLGKIRRISAANLHRSWAQIPHVTQFDEADITDLEAFRKAQKAEAERRGVKLTILSFLMKAGASALREFPRFNASLAANGEELIVKDYVHIGVAVDTENGLLVPVIRDVDKKGLFDIARELGEVSERARARKLSPMDMQGGCFTITSLGGIGGTAFTPIINMPEVSILGVSRMDRRPVYTDGDKLEPRLILPLSLSYDHRVIDGADAARFTTYLSKALSDVRTLLL